MRVRLFVAVVLVLGFVALAAPGFRLSADHRDSTIVGNKDCIQDVPNTTPPPNAVVMCGLDNPRGLAFLQPRRAAHDGDEIGRDEHGSDGGWQHRADARHRDLEGDEGSAFEAALYVAEAGRGGLELTTSNCFTGQAGGRRCYGPNGAISRLWNGFQERVVTGLPSHANLLGGQAIGPHDIALVSQRRHDDRAWATASPQDCDPACAYVTIGLQQPPRFREDHPFLKDFAKLARVSATGKVDYVADLGTYETQNDPDQEFYEPDKLDTNPYGLVAEPGGRAVVVTDAGGNSLLRVRTNGKISTRAVFSPHPTASDDSVPTSVAVGPDGAYYVGELSGFPPALGAANIYRVGRHSESPEVCLSGFTLIIDIAFDKRGNLYVLQYATNFQNASGGSLIRVDRHKGATRDQDDHGGLCAEYTAGNRTTVVTGLFQPTSLAVGPDGAVYISNRGSSARTGQVIRFEPPVQ